MASTPGMQKATSVFALHQIPLECDIYDSTDYPRDGPVFLFFHSGGLISGARSAVPPWLVQVCFQRKWPLISASYRLLPQVDGKGLLDDARAAYDFARTYGGEAGQRPVVVGGASAGFFLATIIAHHLTPKPVALLAITGIPTFRHPFFNSSVLLTPDPIPDWEIERYLVEPVSVGTTPRFDAVFFPEKLLPDGSKNPDFNDPGFLPPLGAHQDPNRGLLYDYYVYNGEFVALVEGVDLGFDWTSDQEQKRKLREWPMTIFIQGDADEGVREDVCLDTARQLGERAIYCLAPGQNHLFERTHYLEDEVRDEQGRMIMAAVWKAVEQLDRVVETSCMVTFLE